MQLIRISPAYATAWFFRAAAWATIAWVIGWRGVLLLAVAAIATQAAALLLHALSERPVAARVLLVLTIVVQLALFASMYRLSISTVALPVGVGVYLCHAISYLVDVRRGSADPRHHLAALLYLVQLPVFPVGPLSRFHEFAHQLSRTDVSMGSFPYGVRRIVTGLIKAFLIAGRLAHCRSPVCTACDAAVDGHGLGWVRCVARSRCTFMSPDFQT